MGQATRLNIGQLAFLKNKETIRAINIVRPSLGALFDRFCPRGHGFIIIGLLFSRFSLVRGLRCLGTHRILRFG